MNKESGFILSETHGPQPQGRGYHVDYRNTQTGVLSLVQILVVAPLVTAPSR